MPNHKPEGSGLASYSQSHKKGVALFMVLATVLISVILANVVLNIITSQNRLTQHKVDHIRAYYAAQAGMVYALEMLRKGTWAYSPTNSCPNSAPCSLPSETDSYLSRVRIVLCPSATMCGSMTTACTPPLGYNFCVTTLFDYP